MTAGDAIDPMELALQVVSALEEEDADPIQVRFGDCGHCATVTKARLTSRGEFVMKGDIGAGDGAFAWKGHVDQMNARLMGHHRRHLTAPDQPSVVLFA